MSKQKENIKLVPELRFPEFEEDCDWEEKNILEIASMKARIGWQNLRREEHLDSGDYYLITGTNFKNGLIDWEKAKYVNYERFIQDENIILKEGDILITKDGSIGKLAYVENIGKKKATLNNGIFRIRPKTGNKKFIFYTFLSLRFKLFLEKLTAGSSITHLYQKDFTNYKIVMPIEPKEQQKIANCLSSLDNLITAETEKLHLLKDHKKGLLQQLFPANGETVPKVRFPEFVEDGDWEEVEIDDLGKIVTGKTPSTKDESLWNGNILFITPTDISDNKYQISTKRTVKKTTKLNILPKGSVVYTCIASIGKIAITTNISITNQQINSIVPFENYNNEFIYYLLVSITSYIKSIPATSTLPIINKTEFSKINCRVPCSIKEQQKIANTLTAVDKLITAQTEKIEALKQHKKGLMQGLFPKIKN
jgi:type I restriction enzyme S subunit